MWNTHDISVSLQQNGTFHFEHGKQLASHFQHHFESGTFHFIEMEWYPFPEKHSIFNMESKLACHFQNGISISKIGTQLKMECTKMESTKWNG